MDLDRATVERLVEQITKEVLILLREEQASAQSGSDCLSCDGQCTEKCPDKAQEVIDAGANRIANPLGSTKVAANIAHMIDHTLLKPDASQAQIAQLCYEARKHGFDDGREPQTAAGVEHGRVPHLHVTDVLGRRVLTR